MCTYIIYLIFLHLFWHYPKFVNSFSRSFSTLLRRRKQHEIQTNLNIIVGMPAYTDKVRPCTLRSGLSALGSGGRSFEEGSHLCFMYLKTIFKKKKYRAVS